MEAIVTGLIISSLVAWWTYVLVSEKRNKRQRLIIDGLKEKTQRRPPKTEVQDDEDFVRGRQTGRLDVVIWLCRSYRGHSAESLALSASNAVRDMNEGRLEP